MSDGGFLRRPGQSYASSYSSGSYGQSRADDEPAPTPQQRDEKQARRELTDANQLAAAAKKLDQVPAAEWQEKRDQLADKLETFAAGLKSHAGATENADHDRAATIAAVQQARETIKHAKPPRAVPPVAGEEAIEPRIADKSIAPEDVIDWMAGLSKSERAAVWDRYQQASTNRADTFAVALANYISRHRDRTPPLSTDLRALATMDARAFAGWRAARDQELHDDGQQLDPLGQSHPLDPAGQSFADPTRDADHDGRADLFRAATPSPAVAPSALAPDHQLGGATQRAADLMRLGLDHIAAIDSTILPAYQAAVAAMDTAAVQALGTHIIGGMAKIRDAQARIGQLVPDVDPRAPQASTPASDPFGSSPDDTDAIAVQKTAFDAQVLAALQRFAVEAGPQKFGAVAITGTVEPAPQLGKSALPYLAHEINNVIELLDEADRIAAQVFATDGASANTAPDPDELRWCVQRLEWHKGRPCNFFFLVHALKLKGCWSTLSHVRSIIDGRTPEDMEKRVTAQAKETGTTADVGRWWDKSTADDSLDYDAGDWAVTDENAMEVFQMLASADPRGRAALVKQLARMGRLGRLGDNIGWQYMKALADSIQDREAEELLEPYWNGKGGVPSSREWAREHVDENLEEGGALNTLQAFGWYFGDFALDKLSFGAKGSIDQAHELRDDGWISDDAYRVGVAKATGRAVAIGAAAAATGGAAGAWAEGAAVGLGESGAALVGNAIGGAAGNVGGQFVGDVYDQLLNGKEGFDSLSSYGRSFAEGGIMGAVTAPIGLAGAKYLPRSAQTMAQVYATRYPRMIRVLERAQRAGVGSAVRFRVTVAQGRAMFRDFMDRLGGGGPGGGFAYATAGAGAGTRSIPPPDASVWVTARVRQNLNQPIARLGDELADDYFDDFLELEHTEPELFDRADAPDFDEDGDPIDPSSHFDGDSTEHLDDLSSMRDDGDDLAPVSDVDDIGTADPSPGGRLGGRRRHVSEPHTPDEFGPDQGFSVADDPHEVWAVDQEGGQITDRHHLFPQSPAEKAWFAERGIDVDDYTIDLSKLDHQIIHGGEQTLARKHWPEKEWRTRVMHDLKREELRLAKRYRTPGRKLTPEEIWEVTRPLMAKFEIDDLPLIHYHAPRAHTP